ncbi:hypothetical protein PFISCL1PPCAC_1058, partial [Pristionchus fissidentatus]
TLRVLACWSSKPGIDRLIPLLLQLLKGLLFGWWWRRWGWRGSGGRLRGARSWSSRGHVGGRLGRLLSLRSPHCLLLALTAGGE